MAAASLTSTSATFTEREVRKGITEVIALETPVTSTIGKDPAPLVATPEWEGKTYASRNSTGWIEGYEFVAGDYQNNLSNKTMFKGRYIKQARPVAVTKEMSLMANQYNRPSPLADNIMDKTKELYSDVEFTLLSDTESVPPVSGTTASVTRSIPRWISNANGRFTDTDTTPTAAYRTPAASILVSEAAATDVTEAEFAGVITNVASTRRKTGLRFMLVATPLARDWMDSFSKSDKSYTTSSFPVSRFAQKQGTIDREVTFYKSSNGSVEMMTSFDLDSTVHWLLLTPDLVRLAYAQGVKVSNDGASSQVEKKCIDVIYTTKMLNPGAFGKAITGATA